MGSENSLGNRRLILISEQLYRLFGCLNRTLATRDSLTKMKLKLVLLIFLSVSLHFSGYTQATTPTKGKLFWMGFMKNYEVEPNWESLDLFIVSDQNTTGTVSVPGQSWSQDFTVVPNTTTTVTIPNDVAEVYSNQIIESKGVLIETADTVAVFAINFNGYTADGSMILPIQTLSTEYRIVAYQGLDAFYDYNSEFLIVATEDDTEVEIELTGNTMDGDLAGQTITVQLNQGECYQVRGDGYLDDFTGTVVRGTESSGSCRPFAVFSGSDCTNIPFGCTACDHIYEQNFPVDTWGTTFHIVPFDVVTSYTYKVLANENNTSVTLSDGTSFTLNAGEFEEINLETEPVCVIGDKPINVTQFMQGTTCTGSGDPAMIIMNDETQKIENITFSTIESDVITSHNLNIVIETAAIGTLTLDGVLVPNVEFNVFPTCENHSYAQLTISEGSHTLDSPEGFSAYVYGTGSAESYGYSVGTFRPIPPIDIDTVFCTNGQIILEQEFDVYNPYWYNISDPEDTLGTGYTYTILPPIENAVIVGAGSELASGCPTEQYYSIESSDVFPLSIEALETEVCQFESVLLEALALPESAIYNYSWTPTAGLDDPTSATVMATPLQSTTYTVTVSTLSGCATSVASVTIDVTDGDITTYEVLPSDYIEFCTGDEVQLDMYIESEIFFDDFDPGISWGEWADISNGTESGACGSVSGNALYFNGAGTRSATTNPLDVSSGGTIHFTLKVADGVAPCENADPGDNIELAYSTDNGGSWPLIQLFFESAYPDFTTIDVPIPAAAETANTQFRWRQIGFSNNNEDNWVLDNVYIGAENTAAFDYEWSPSAGLSADDIQNPIATPLLTTTYIVELFDPVTQCLYADSVLIDVGQGFNLDITPDTVLCDAQGIELYAIPDIAGEFDYLWSPNTDISGMFSATPTVSPTSTTTYSVEVTSSQGCSETGEVEIVVNELLDLEATASDEDICAGETITLEAIMVGDPDGVTFEWTPSNWIDNPDEALTDAQPFDNVTFTVTATHDESGCQLTESVTIDVLQVFTVDITPNDTSACVTNGMELIALASTNEQLDWEWSPSNLVDDSGTPFTFMTQNTSAQLVVIATNNADCSATDTLNVTLLVETTDLGPDSSFCIGETITVNTGWPSSYAFDWSNGDTTSTVDLTEGGIYTVDVTSPLGCTSSDEIELTMYTYPVVDLVPDTALCQSQSLELDAGNVGLNFSWSTGENTQTIVVTTTDDYSVTVDNNYCFTSDDVTVIFNPLPINNLPADTMMCFGFPPYYITLDAGNAGATYIWSTGENTQSIDLDLPGLYSVGVTTPFGCTYGFATIVDEICAGSIYIPNSFSPNNDGINDYWKVYGENIEDFNLKLFNRWGELIFETSDLEKYWIGQRRDGDTYCENGTYLYQISYRLRDENGVLSDRNQALGHITLFR